MVGEGLRTGHMCVQSLLPCLEGSLAHGRCIGWEAWFSPPDWMTTTKSVRFAELQHHYLQNKGAGLVNL